MTRTAVEAALAGIDADDPDVPALVSTAKAFAGDTLKLVAAEMIQMHGGIGMSWEMPLSHYAKRLVMLGHILGDEDEHLARYMALGEPA